MKTKNTNHMSLLENDSSLSSNHLRESPLRERARTALAMIVGGTELDIYFGVSSGCPRQTHEQATEAARLLRLLRELPEECAGRSIFDEIATHVHGSGADARALRALRSTPRPMTGRSALS